MIRLTDVAKEYPRSGVALAHASFEVKKGEFVYLTGPSGSGKTTILRLLYMDDKPTKGEVWVNGVSSNTATGREISRLRRRLGIVFQDFRLLEDRSAEANVRFALEVTGAPKATIRAKVARVLTQVGLSSKATNFPRELSGGEQQRVAIARALINDPFVLIADEPTGNLDERATRSVFQLLRDINASGTAVIMATHDLDLVRRSNYRTIELNHGRVVFDSAESPASARPIEEPIEWRETPPDSTERI
ncbi:MAG TPA: cell division ATP-binding protein FtsE [Gemmatimonadaceae bacterium]|jgi:cell division transport system ATP-binding protein|nr:cell division ATP-binding protein FtsE [Gemmatimonadaceae bacterium]